MKKKQKKVIHKKKKVTPRRTKVRLKCVHMQISTKKIIFDSPNEHGAMDDLVKDVPVYELTFSYSGNTNIRNHIPDVMESRLYLAVSDKSVYDKFEIGKEYDLFPKL